MAILSCVVCRGGVSSLAVTCPHCGAPVSATIEAQAAARVEVAAPNPSPAGTTHAPSAPGPAAPGPAPRDIPSIESVVRFKLLGIGLVLAAIGWLAFIIVTHHEPVLALGQKRDPSADSNNFRYMSFPLMILSLMSGAAFNAARLRKNKIESMLRGRS